MIPSFRVRSPDPECERLEYGWAENNMDSALKSMVHQGAVSMPRLCIIRVCDEMRASLPPTAMSFRKV